MNVLDHDAEDFLDRIEQRMDEYKGAAEKAAEIEARFKSWDASKRTALMDNGLPANRAQEAVRADPEWAERFIEMEFAKIAAEDLKNRIQQGVRWFEAWRSRYSAEKRAV